MKHLKILFSTSAIVAGLSMGNVVHAQMAVVDFANLANTAQQVTAWGKQYQQMYEHLQQMKQQYSSQNGNRGMGNLVNNPANRQYMPTEYQQMLNNGYGNSADIRAGAKTFGIEGTTLGPGTDSARAFESSGNQAALNRATSEEAYKQAGQRFAKIQVLLDKVNAAPETKDIADLQARIQAEQVMLQNESIKLAALAQLQQSQRDLSAQQSIEIGMKATKGEVPRF